MWTIAKKSEVGTTVGIISDTHGLLRPEAVAALLDCDVILHAGDIGNPEILEKLRDRVDGPNSSPVPVIAVRGNNDKGTWAETIPETELVQVEDVLIHMRHIEKELAFDPKAAGVQVVISGHSHKPVIQEREGVLFINPGSAGPRRFKLPVSVARLQVKDAEIEAQILELPIK